MKFEGPFGVVHSRNITPDPGDGHRENGPTSRLSTLSARGRDNQGKMLFPYMPYTTFSGMSDQDAADLVAFIRSVPPIKNAVPEDQLKFPVPPVTAPAPPRAVAPASGVARGTYLVNHVSNCIECHTPTTATGAPDLTKLLAGGFNVLTGAFEPTHHTRQRDRHRHLERWKGTHVLLKTGQKPMAALLAD